MAKTAGSKCEYGRLRGRKSWVERTKRLITSWEVKQDNLRESEGVKVRAEEEKKKRDFDALSSPYRPSS